MPFTFPHIIKNIIRLVYRKRKSVIAGRLPKERPRKKVLVNLF